MSSQHQPNGSTHSPPHSDAAPTVGRIHRCLSPPPRGGGLWTRVLEPSPGLGFRRRAPSPRGADGLSTGNRVPDSTEPWQPKPRAPTGSAEAEGCRTKTMSPVADHGSVDWVLSLCSLWSYVLMLGIVSVSAWVRFEGSARAILHCNIGRSTHMRQIHLTVPNRVWYNKVDSEMNSRGAEGARRR